MAFVVDFDFTVIASVKYIAAKYSLIVFGNKDGLVPDTELERIRPLFVESARKLVRPHFSEFMRVASEQATPVYIYTASMDSWANFIVPIVEEIVGYRFARPLFTRKDCMTGSWTKSLATIRSRIGDLQDDCITIIDDNASAWPADSARLIVCPKYEHLEFEDAFVGVHPTILNHPSVKSLIQLDKNALFPPVSNLVSRYAFCVAEIRRINRASAKQQPDSFWADMKRG